MRPLLLAGKEVEAISARPEDRRTHKFPGARNYGFRPFGSTEALGQTAQGIREPLEPLFGAPGGARDVVLERYRR